MRPRELSFFRAVFALAAVWNLAGGIIGYFNPEHAFHLLFGRELVDPLYYGIYRGACGTTLVYFIGYSVVALNPVRHTGIVLVGGIGKIGFVIQLVKFYLAGIANANAFVVIVGDVIFFGLFLFYYLRVARSGYALFGGGAAAVAKGRGQALATSPVTAD